MSNEVNPATTGDNPILDKGPTVEIEGHEYTVRRLGIRDTFAVAKIVAVGAAASRQPLSNADMANPEKMGNLLLAGFMSAENTAMDLLASLIGVKTKDFEDPEQFPMGSELAIIDALIGHQDLKAFLARAGALMKRLPEMQTRSQGQSTS